MSDFAPLQTIFCKFQLQRHRRVRMNYPAARHHWVVCLNLENGSPRGRWARNITSKTLRWLLWYCTHGRQSDFWKGFAVVSGTQFFVQLNKWNVSLIYKCLCIAHIMCSIWRWFLCSLFILGRKHYINWKKRLPVHTQVTDGGICIKHLTETCSKSKMRDIWKERHQISSVLPVSIISWKNIKTGWKRLKIALLTTVSFPDNWAVSPERPSHIWEHISRLPHRP